MTQALRPVPDLSYPPEARRWPPAFPPAHASAWGDDQYGLWIDVVIGGPVQRFRWIEPGEFVMGSPEGEAERRGDEGPQHVVRLTDGFWLAETVCSQAVWEAVMGTNPSMFSGLKNPVEQVRWSEVQDFLRAVEALLPCMLADLPTEAEWEYACRAGTLTAFSFGEFLDADYLNCSFFGSDEAGAGSWNAGGFYRGETVPVRSFVPNAWGLYQMHGNVSEWCADNSWIYESETEIDPRGPEDDDEHEALRAVRGGSYLDGVDAVRSASRELRHIEERTDDLGFRFLLRSTSPGAERPPEAAGTRDA